MGQNGIVGPARRVKSGEGDHVAGNRGATAERSSRDRTPGGRGRNAIGGHSGISIRRVSRFCAAVDISRDVSRIESKEDVALRSRRGNNGHVLPLTCMHRMLVETGNLLR